MISDSCLNLRKLCLPSVLESTELEDGEHHLLDILPNQSLPGSFLSFSSLRALTSSHWVLRPECFQTLGDLPQLESLELFPEPSVINLPGSVLLHENSFPALKRLSLRQLSWNRIGIILKHQLLIKNIVSLELVAILTSDSWEEADAALLELVNIENLTNLVIDFNDQDCYEIYPDNPSLEILSQLPLRSVKLVQAQFMAIDQIRFPRIFPTLTELRVLYQSADLVEFSRFATIPNLKHLVFRAWDLRATDLTASVKLPVCPSLDTLQVTTGFSYPFPVQEVHTIARYFRKLFPNLKKITWLNGAGDTVADRDMTLLNAYIAMLRERSNARARVAEQCGWDVANQLLPDDDESIRPVV
ncbi:hypothetical protein FRC08_007195 [Ceratobasidium sp. 394]|nr:hypothetical protein FRC08_007195 [Ceratobasidium sp. 394]